MTRIMLNPSCQYENIIRDEEGHEIYNEGENLYDFAIEIKKILDEDPNFETYISRDGRKAESDLDTEIEMTNRLNCDLLIALHSDASGDNNPYAGGTWTFAKREYFPLAECIQKSVLSAIHEVYPESQNRGYREHWYHLRVLWKTHCPGCLTEILFHTNPKERELLKDIEFKQKVAEGFVKGIRDYLKITAVNADNITD